MSTDLVLLANGAASDKVVNEYRKSQPPKVVLDNSFSSKVSEVSKDWRGMDRVE